MLLRQILQIANKESHLLYVMCLDTETDDNTQSVACISHLYVS